MRLLVSGSRASMPYAIVSMLRKSATHVAFCDTRDRATGFARSRLMDSFHLIPDIGLHVRPEALEEATTEYEHNFLDRILEICESERIDTIVPISDHEVYLYAKHRELFARRGVLVATSPLSALQAVMDKLRAVETASAAGMPVPRTLAPGGMADAAVFANEVGYPVVVKARFSHGSAAVRYAADRGALHRAQEELAAWPLGVVVQEYIPGTDEPSINFVLDREGRILLGYTLAKLRYLHPSHSSCIETTEMPPEAARAARMLQDLGMCGFVAVQTKRDERSGELKLIEINHRWGSNSRIVFRIAAKLGVNMPLLAIDAVAGRATGDPLFLPAGLRGVSPLEDLTLVPLSHARMRREARRAGTSEGPSTAELLSSYARSYSPRRSSTDVFSRALVRDPAAAAAYFRMCWGERNSTAMFAGADTKRRRP